jgi:DNA-binding beta-propeller fold protein YncE
MARTAVTHSAVSKDASSAMPTGVAVDPTNGHVLAAPPDSGHIVLDIDATFAGAKTYTVKKGVLAGAGLGDLVLSLNAQRVLVPVSLYRFVQADGTILVDVQAGATGTVRAYRIPYGD